MGGKNGSIRISAKNNPHTARCMCRMNMIIAALKLSHSILFCSNYFKPLVCRWRLIGMQAPVVVRRGGVSEGRLGVVGGSCDCDPLEGSCCVLSYRIKVDPQPTPQYGSLRVTGQPVGQPGKVEVLSRNNKSNPSGQDTSM